jgi:hypothetical protein
MRMLFIRSAPHRGRVVTIALRLWKWRLINQSEWNVCHRTDPRTPLIALKLCLLPTSALIACIQLSFFLSSVHGGATKMRGFGN